MAPIGDYIITFCSILFGLAVGDILVDFNRLLPFLLVSFAYFRFGSTIAG